MNLVDGVLNQVPRLVIFDLNHLLFRGDALGQVFIEDGQFAAVPAQRNIARTGGCITMAGGVVLLTACANVVWDSGSFHAQYS
jgi:hypothetical protein